MQLIGQEIKTKALMEFLEKRNLQLMHENRLLRSLFYEVIGDRRGPEYFCQYCSYCDCYYEDEGYAKCGYPGGEAIGSFTADVCIPSILSGLEAREDMTKLLRSLEGRTLNAEGGDIYATENSELAEQ